MDTPSLSHRPALVLMAGFPGVGKSTVALELARRTQMVVLDKDDILTSILRVREGSSPELCSFLAYEILLDLVAKQLSCGQKVIVDSCLTYQWLRDRLMAIAIDNSAEPVVAYLECPPRMAEARILDRQNVIGFSENRTVAEHRRIKGIYEPFHDDLPVHTFDATLQVSKLVIEIVNTLKLK